MSPAQRLFSLMATLVGLGLGTTTASAQWAGTANPYAQGVNPLSYNTGTLGKDRPLGMGYTMATNPLTSTIPTAPAVTGTPYGGSPGPQGYGGYGGYYPYPMSRQGSKLQGQAAVVSSAGQYYVSTQQASILREKSRQASLETQKQRLTFEMQYEDIKNQRNRQAIENEKFAVLDRARRDATDVEIWSGKTFNVLLKSILAAPSPIRGPNISLDESTLRGLNLTDGASKGSLALAKDEGKIEWTDAFEDPSFDDVRKRFSSNFATAMKMAQTGEKPARSILTDLKSDLKSLDDKLEDQVGTLTPTSYIESRRVIKKLNEGVKGLSNSHVVASCNSSWKKDVRTVADLVAYCQQKGLEFGPAAASGDRPCYQAAYYSFRSYERGVVQLASAAQ